MKERRLKLIDQDPWLEPAAKDIEARFERYQWKLNELEQLFGSLLQFADGYTYFGLNYDAERKGWVYREWAPAARDLFIFGDFNNWHRSSLRMIKDSFGVWEIFLDDETWGGKIGHGTNYKVMVHGGNGWHERIPAYAGYVVQNTEDKSFCSQIWHPEKKFNWKGDKFSLTPQARLFIYECHVGMAQEKEDVGTYREFADLILPRIKDAGYNAIQMMAIHEHPYYGSFGYHVSNFFAPSSRFGTPDDLRYLVKKAHSLGIAVIMDIVHSHTVKNFNEGLNQFDGSDSHYFHPGSRGIHPDWDSLLFDYGKTEVLRFLLSNIKYWLMEFHFDGFRFDGVGSMMYFHHGHTSFGEQDKYFNEGVEYDALIYLQLANTLSRKIYPGVVTIAEDVTGMPGLSFPVEEGGLGFDYRLGMGLPDYWIKQLEEQDEDWHMGTMWHTLSNRLPGVGTLAYCESHDQALVGDKTIAFRLMDADMYWNMGKSHESLVIDRGIALHKLIRLVTITLGGTAWLNFMGNEFGHPEWVDFPREGNNWSYWYARRQWSLRDSHSLKYHYLADFDQAMIRLFRDYDIFSHEYAEQLLIDEWHKTLAGSRGGLVFAFNFHSNMSVPNYEIPVPALGKYRVLLCSDNPQFGGQGRLDETILYPATKRKDDPLPHIRIYFPNRTAFVLKLSDE
jgi:1,4-alpha-glucan branching enzyme